MTKAERQSKPCFICGKRESEHPGGQFCPKEQNAFTESMNCSAEFKVITYEPDMFNTRRTTDWEYLLHGDCNMPNIPIVAIVEGTLGVCEWCQNLYAHIISRRTV